MSSRRLLGLALSAAALVAPSCALPQAVGGGYFFVKNNTDERLRCRYRIDDGAWRPYFRFNRGSEFRLDRRPGMTTVYFFCDPPVRRVTYVLRSGERQSLLRAADQSIEMRNITTDGGFGGGGGGR